MNKKSLLILTVIFTAVSITTASAAASLSVGAISYDKSTMVKEESMTVTSSVTASSVTGTLTVDVTLTNPSELFNIPIATQQVQFTTDGTKSVTWTITASTAGENNNPFTISASGDDDSSGSQTTSPPVTVQDRPIITVSASTDISSVLAGDSIVVSYIVSNSASAGAADATNVEIALSLPGSWSLTSGNSSYSLGSVAPSASKSGSWTITADSPSSSNIITLNTTSTIPGGTVTKTVSISGPSDISTSSSGGGGGGGSGTSGEAYDNIQTSETKRQYVYKDSKISYKFDSENNVVHSITFTGLTNAGSIATKVEILNDVSSLVDKAPSGKIYKYINIWVGSSGWASSDNIDNPKVGFKVENSWINANYIDASTITLNRYSSGSWKTLKTTKIGEDTNCLIFEAETPDGFSPFSITSDAISTSTDDISPVSTEDSSDVSEATSTATSDISDKEKKRTPGFHIFAGVSALLIVIYLLRKK